MTVVVAHQTQIFLGACLLGGFLGVIYDFFRISRLAFHLPRVVILLEDVLFFVICGVVTFLYLAETNDGQVRYFIMLGLLLGATLYYFTLGEVVMRVSSVIIGFVSKTLSLIFGLVSKIFALFHRLVIVPVKRLANWIGRMTSQKSKKLLDSCKKLSFRRK